MASLRRLEGLGIWAALLTLMLIASIASPYFLTPGNLVNVLNQASVAGIAAIGVTFVMVTGGVDLSIGSVISLSAALAGSVMAGKDGNVLAAIVIGVVAGAAVGLLNGVAVAYRNIPSFILTLGMATVVAGSTLLYTGGTAKGAVAPGFVSSLGGRPLLGIPSVVWIFIAVFVVAIAIERNTVFGRRLFVVGSNMRAADLAGLPVNRVLVGAYVLSGLLGGLAGIVLLARVGVSSAYAGQGYEFDSLAAAVLGGTTFEGGRGGVIGTLAGILILVVAFNLVSIAGLDFNAQMLVKGAIIIGAASIYRAVQRF